MTRVVVVDDHPLVLEGMKAVLEGNGDGEVEVVGAFRTAEDALDAVGRLRPHVAVVDVRLPGMTGIDACGLLRRRHAGVRVLVLSSFPSESTMVRALAEGADGFLVKESELSLVRQAVRSIAAGGTFIDPRLAVKLVARVTRTTNTRGPFGLTVQELRVLALLPGGHSNPEIARELGVAASTVKTHLRHVLEKLHVRDRTEAAAVAVREGLAS